MADCLFGLVKNIDKSLFRTFMELKVFIQSRTNIFQADPTLSSKIRNRSIEYREAMLYIVNQLKNSSKQRNVNYISAELGSHYPKVKRCEIGSGDAAMSKFVSEHTEILEFTGPEPLKADHRPVRVKATAVGIPSVWIKKALPEYDPSVCRYDRSIVINATGCVVSLDKDTNYLKLEITGSTPHKGESVYVVGKNVGARDGELVECFPRNSLVRECDNLTLNWVYSI